MVKEEDEGVEVVCRSSAGGLSILTNKQENETVPSFEEDAGGQDEVGQEATLVEERSSPSKTMFGSIYKSLRRKKMKHHNIILPPQLSAQLDLRLGVDERHHEANQKADYARRLLEAAFRPEEAGWDKQDPAEFKGMKRIDMIETAFKYAVEARRLIGTESAAEDAALDDHRAQGEAAALESHHFILACKSKALLTNLDAGEEDDGSINGGLYTPQDIQDAADKHRNRAYFHMEHILSTFDKKIKAPDHIILNHSPERNGEDVTLSTLGFDNTFQDLSPTSKEKYSITSLNELLDGPQSLAASKPVIQTAKLQQTEESQQLSPLSGTVESQLKPEFEQQITKTEAKEQDKARPQEEKKKSKIKPGTLLFPSLSRRIIFSKKEKTGKRDDDDASSNVSSISELESIRALENDINNKLRAAAERDDGEFSFVGDEVKIEGPKFVRAPSLDLSIMSLENWDKVAEGSSLDAIVKQAEAEKERKIRGEHDILPVVVPQPEPEQKQTWTSRLWRSRSENFAHVKAPLATDTNTAGPSALELQKARMTGKKPGVIPPPFVIVSCEDRVQSTLDDVAPKYQVQSMNIFGVDAAPANEDALTKSSRVKPWKKMVSWKNPVPSKVLSAAKLGRNKFRDVDTEEGVYNDGPKGITNSTDTEACSWAEGRLKASEPGNDYEDTYRTLAEDVDEAIERAEKEQLTKDPLDSGIDMLLNNANPDIVRKVLSADACKVDGDSGNPIDFADVEYENEDAVRRQSALMSRDAVLQNIYADRPPAKTATPLERSATHTNGVGPSSSFMDMIDQEKHKNEMAARKPKRRASFFHRRKGRESVMQ